MNSPADCAQQIASGMNAGPSGPHDPSHLFFAGHHVRAEAYRAGLMSAGTRQHSWLGLRDFQAVVLGRVLILLHRTDCAISIGRRSPPAGGIRAPAPRRSVWETRRPRDLFRLVGSARLIDLGLPARASTLARFSECTIGSRCFRQPHPRPSAGGQIRMYACGSRLRT